MVVAVALVLALPGRAWPQASTGEPGKGAPPDTSPPQPTRPAETAGPPIERWFDLQTASLMARYRWVQASAGEAASDQLQDNVILRARFKFDAKAAYTINGEVATGPAFTSGWNNTGVGDGERAIQMSLKQLFLAARPLAGLELLAGGIAIVRGETTEITSYDNDGYLMGERVSVRRPGQLYFDEMTFTNAYLGDLDAPGVMHRFHRLGEPNYRQLLVRKRISSRFAGSADYTRVDGVGTVRAAVAARTPEARVADLVVYEQYRRLGDAGAFGFAAFGEKALFGRATIGAGYADIDEQYGGLNADRFNRGRRLFEQASVRLTRDLGLSIFLCQAVHNAFPVSNRRRVDVVLNYNAMGPLRRAGLFRGGPDAATREQ